MRKEKILIVGDDIEALLAYVVLSDHFNVTLCSHIYKDLDYYREKFYKKNYIKWNQVMKVYLDLIPFCAYRNRNVKETKAFVDLLDIFDIESANDFIDESEDNEIESLFDKNKSFQFLEEDTLKDVLSNNSGSLFAIYDNNNCYTIDKYLSVNKDKDKMKLYRDKVWPSDLTARYLLSDPEIMATSNLLRFNAFEFCQKLIEYSAPIYYDTLNDPTCEEISHLYDYIFFTGKMNNKIYSKAYHNKFQLFNASDLKIKELSKYDNIYFNDNSNIIRIYFNGDYYHALVKYEPNKTSTEYNKDITNKIGDCVFFDYSDRGRIIKNHLLRNNEKYRIIPNSKLKDGKFPFKIIDDNIYSRTTQGYVESPDMFVDNLNLLIEHIKDRR